MSDIRLEYEKLIKLPEEDTLFECKSLDDMNSKMFWYGLMDGSCYVSGAGNGEYYRECKKNGFKYKFVIKEGK